MAKTPRWLRQGQKLLIEVEIARIADDDSYLAVELPGIAQRVRFDTATLERLIELGAVQVEEG